MNIYSITKGQLITIWIFWGIIQFAYLLEWDGLAGLLEWDAWAAFFEPTPFVMLFLIIFYSIGWKNSRKSKR